MKNKSLSRSLIVVFALLLMFTVVGFSSLTTDNFAYATTGNSCASAEGNAYPSNSEVAYQSNSEAANELSFEGYTYQSNSEAAEVAADEHWEYGENGIKINELKQIVDGFDKTKFSKSQPLVIVVIDTGINAAHEVFSNTLLRDKDGNALGYNSHDNNKEIEDKDPNMHGTAVASIIAMTVRELGLQDYIKIYPIKASYQKKGDAASYFSINSVTAALKHISSGAVANVCAVNMSFGIFKSQLDGNPWDKDKNLLMAIDTVAMQSTIIAAAGNGVSGMSNIGKDSKENPFYPAVHDGIVSVMSYGKDGKKVASSNYGSRYNLIAPGEGIWTAGKGNAYEFKSGTSMASPFVATASALLKLKLQDDKNKGKIAQVPSATAQSRILRKHGNETIEFNPYTFKKLSIKSLLTADYSIADTDYDAPTGIKIIATMQGNAGKDNKFIVRTDNITPLNLSASALPYGDTDPELDMIIEWWQLEGEAENESYLGKGKNFTFVPTLGGDFKIEARLTAFEKTHYASVEVSVVYCDFIAGDVKITYASDANKKIDDAANVNKVYTTERVKLALTGVQFVDRTKEVKWFVNGEYVASGYEFEFSPKKIGQYTVTATYDDKPISYDHSLVLDVKSFMLRPLDLATAIVVPLIILGSIVLAVVLSKKRKNRTI
ncbi:MAG: S8 family serine peptidase [Clostridia bacterium]